jgi:hypothetical protein
MRRWIGDSAPEGGFALRFATVAASGEHGEHARVPLVRNGRRLTGETARPSGLAWRIAAVSAYGLAVAPTVERT